MPFLEHTKNLGFLFVCWFGVLVSWFQGFLVSGFGVYWLLGCWFLGFYLLLSWFLGLKVAWFLRFKDSKKPLMFSKDIWSILPNVHFTLFFDRY